MALTVLRCFTGKKKGMFPLLLMLFSWVVDTQGCETGVAFVGSILSVQRSLMANADVALLESYNASTLNQCLEQCCSGKYGACSVASFKKNVSTENCLHFNCRPLHKCKFLSSNSTDSFSFSSNPITPLPDSVKQNKPDSVKPSTVKPLKVAKTQESFEQSHAKELNSNEQFALKNDNTTVKPRKGVDALTPDAILVKSGVKPRKGVSIEDVPHSKLLPNSLNRSNIKPRKGVGPYSTTTESPISSSISNGVASSLNTEHQTTTSINPNSTEDDVMFDLEKVFEDDSRVATTTEPQIFSTHHAATIVSDHNTEEHTKTIYNTAYPLLLSSEPGVSKPEISSASTPPIQSSSSIFSFVPTAVEEQTLPSTTMASSPTVLVAVAPEVTTDKALPSRVQTLVSDYVRDEALDELIAAEKETEENNRRYKSSIHLVLALVFGLLVLFAVLGVVAKRIYDGWVRRDYYRMNYLIDGIYNGVH